MRPTVIKTKRRTPDSPEDVLHRVLGRTLTALDFRSPLVITFVTGTFMYFDAGLYARESGYIYVYTEHHGYHVFHDGDLMTVKGDPLEVITSGWSEEEND